MPALRVQIPQVLVLDRGKIRDLEIAQLLPKLKEEQEKMQTRLAGKIETEACWKKMKGRIVYDIMNKFGGV